MIESLSTEFSPHALRISGIDKILSCDESGYNGNKLGDKVSLKIIVQRYKLKFQQFFEY